MFRAGDVVKLLVGEQDGREAVIHAVRYYATDCGYYVEGGEGLYGPDQVEFVRERAGGNPCGVECDAKWHADNQMCGHCRGRCLCRMKGVGA